MDSARPSPAQGNVTSRELEHWFYAAHPRLKQVRVPGDSSKSCSSFSTIEEIRIRKPGYSFFFYYENATRFSFAQTVDFVTERVVPEVAARVHALFDEALSYSLQETLYVSKGNCLP